MSSLFFSRTTRATLGAEAPVVTCDRTEKPMGTDVAQAQVNGTIGRPAPRGLST